MLKVNDNAKTTMGQRAAAMILNGLGFTGSRLYIFPKFLEQKAVFKLFGDNLDPDNFNDDCLGRLLDAIHDYGETALFSHIALNIGLNHGLLKNKIHVDTTTLTLHGEYDTDVSQEANIAIPEYGYSKSKRFDLKQMTLLTASVGSASFPVYMEPLSGNASDQKTLMQACQNIQKFCQELKNCPQMLFVADSAMYDSCIKKGQDLLWLTRVPQNIKACNELIKKDVLWQELPDGYKMHITTSNYGDIKQRWLLYFSQQAYDKEIITLDKNITKEHTELTKELWHLSCQKFTCQDDALKKANKLKANYHDIKYTIEELNSYTKKGRPTITVNKANIKTEYKINAHLVKNQTKIDAHKKTKGRFVLATNQTIDELPDNQVLQTYKEQSGNESGFKFIKNRDFQIDNVFLKKPSRISALMMIMTLCLMVHAYSDNFIKEELKKNNDKIPNQVDKLISNPTMTWIYKLFHNISLCTIKKDRRYFVAQLTIVQQKIIRYFGEDACKIYDLAY